MAIERIIGVDFGTSTSVIRVKRYENGKPVGNGARLDTQKVFDLVPTVIQEMNGHQYYGEEALTPKGRNAIIHRGFKVNLESTDEEKREQARKLTEEFMAYLAAAYKTDSEGGHLGDSTDKERTIISYPVKWSDTTKTFMLEAARKAGFPNVEGMDEAQAAINAVVVQNQEMLLSKKYLQEDLPATILLIDMGAGTTDLVLCRYTPGKQPKNEILATWPKDGNILFGGQEVDELLRNWATQLFEDKTQAEFVLKRIPLEQFKAWKETEVAKLLENNETVEQFYTLDDLADMAGVALNPYNLDRVAFESCTESYLKQFPELVKGCLQSAGIAGEQVDLVVLTGGHSQWYFVKEILAGNMPQVSPILLPQIAQNCSRIVQVAHPQETAALGMVFSPLSMHFEKEEPSKTTVDSNQADTKTQVLEHYRHNVDKLVCVASLPDRDGKIFAVTPDGELLSDNRSVSFDSIHDIAMIARTRDCRRLYYLKKDGTVGEVSTGVSPEIEKWSNITTIACGQNHIVGLCSDGTVRAFGAKASQLSEIQRWRDIVSIACGNKHTVAIDKYGRAFYAGEYVVSDMTINKWTDIVQVACGDDFTVGLNKNGSIDYAVEKGDYAKEVGQELKNWNDIASVCCSSYAVMALKKNGTVAACEVTTISPSAIRCTREWCNIVEIATNGAIIAGLTSDGTVVSNLDSVFHQKVTSDWQDMVAIFSSNINPPEFGLKYTRSILGGITKGGEIRWLEYGYKKKGLLSWEIDPNSLQNKVTSWSLWGGFEKLNRTSDVITWDDIIGDAPDIDTSILNW